MGGSINSHDKGHRYVKAKGSLMQSINDTKVHVIIIKINNDDYPLLNS